MEDGAQLGKSCLLRDPAAHIFLLSRHHSCPVVKFGVDCFLIHEQFSKTASEEAKGFLTLPLRPSPFTLVRFFPLLRKKKLQAKGEESTRRFPEVSSLCQCNVFQWWWWFPEGGYVSISSSSPSSWSQGCSRPSRALPSLLQR